MTHGHDRIQAYLDGELDAAGRQAMEAHLAGCAECREELAAARRLWEAVDAGLATGPLKPLWPDLAVRLAARRRAVWTWPQRALAAAAVAAGLLVGTQVGPGVPMADPADPAGGSELAAGDYLQTSLPTLDQSWLLLGDQDEDTGS